MKTVVLLNPPSRRVQLRDLYCSITSKGNYLWPPIDLLVLSGNLKDRFALTVVDAVAEGFSPRAAQARVAAAKPSAVISLTGSASWPEDADFLSMMTSRLGCLVAVCGDLCLDPDPWFLRDNPWLHALIADFTTPEVGAWLLAEGRSEQPFAGIRHRFDGKIVEGWSAGGGHGARTFSYPPPRHDLFPLGRYRLPFVRDYPVTSILTNYACPFHCTYCVQSNGVLGHKHRPIENVLEELEAIRVLGVRELYFRDPLFESRPADALRLCGELRERFSFSWACNCRADTLTDELAAAMKAAGCRCIAFGFESVDTEVLRRHGKPLTVEQFRSAIALCRRHGIEVAGYFILGLPGERTEECLQTIDFAVRSGIDYASFAVPSPDHGTPLRREVVAAGKIGPDFRVFDRSRAGVSFSEMLGTEDLNRMLRIAASRFYFRPAYILKTLGRVRGFRQGLEILRAGWAVLRGYLTDLGRPAP